MKPVSQKDNGRGAATTPLSKSLSTPQPPLVVAFHKTVWTVKDPFQNLDNACAVELGEGTPEIRGKKFAKFCIGTTFKDSKSSTVFLSRRNNYGWRSVRIEGTLENLKFLERITKETGRCFNLLKNEIAFDLKYIPEEELYIALDRIAYRLIPEFGRNVRLNIWPPDGNGNEKKLPNGDISGIRMYSFYAIDEKLHKKKNIDKVQGKHISSKMRAYVKFTGGNWIVRIEFIALKSMKDLPYHPFEYARLARVQFDIKEFARFYTIDYTAFKQAIRKYCAKNGKRYPAAMLRDGENKPGIEQMRWMRDVAAEIGNQNLKNTCRKRFTREISLAEAITTPLAFE